MKNISTIFLLTIIAAIFTSCKSDQALIEQSAMGYLTAMGNYRISEAKPFATEETIENTLKTIEQYIMPNLDSTVIKENTPAIIKIDNITKTGDTTAEVSYVKYTPKQKQEGKLDMVKRKGEWKVQVRIQIPESLKIEQSIDVKAVEDKYKGKLKVSDSNEVPTVIDNQNRNINTEK